MSLCDLSGKWTRLISASYAVKELKADLEKEIAKLPEEEREAAKTEFAIFVVHNKLKEKAEQLPEDVPYEISLFK